MPVYKGSIEKALGNTRSAPSWRNNYWLSAVGPDEALVKLEVIAAAEQAFHSTGVYTRRAVVSDPSHLQNQRSTSIDLPGERVISGAAIPMWNVVTVLFLDLDHSRPERKYYRVELGEGDIDGSHLTVTLFDLVNGVMETLIGGSSAPCTPTGGTILSAEVQGLIGMRQTGWHRRTRPGFKRGYVPV